VVAVSSVADDFSRYVCPTSNYGTSIEVARASGCYIYDTAGREYLDFISGIAVNNVGHCHPDVVEAVEKQVRLYAHTMVYGEHLQSPQVELARKIAEVAPPGLDTTYFLTTGAEANDAALKLAIKVTGRHGIVAFHKAYHGDTVGALSCFGEESYRRDFAPLLHNTQFLPFGSDNHLEQIDEQTACVLVEPVQGEAGIIPPPDGWLKRLRDRCTATGALLIFDEVQTGFGRVGDWFAALRYGVTPDIVTVAKGMGMGMPLAGVIGPRDMMLRFAAEPAFAHITTFGGHPVSCAAGLAGMRVIQRENLLANCNNMGELLIDLLQDVQTRISPLQTIRGVGLMIGCALDSEERARRVVIASRAAGLILETTLLDEKVIRFSPPLIVNEQQCRDAVAIFETALAQS
jgi:acetylornithine/N-succinyldiaminopimelate aminotransferase